MLCPLFKPASAQNIFDYDAKAVNGDNIVVFGSVSFNSSTPMIKRADGWSHTAKGAISTVPSLGILFHKSIGDRLSIRAGFSLGYANYAFKYAQSYDSLTENFTPVLSSKFNKYTRVKHGSGFAMPQIDLGYIFGPFKKMYLLEVRGGVGFHAYLSQSNDSIVDAKGSVSDSRYTYFYHSTEQAKYGQPAVYGSLVGNFYIGMRWQKTMSNFLNHFSLGIQATVPISTSEVGYSQLEYKNEAYEVISRERVEFSLFSFGLKASYGFL